jgi:hypothetical protein
MKSPAPIDLDEPLLNEMFGGNITEHCSDKELHQLLQDLIDSDHRLLIELKLTAWHEANSLHDVKNI